MIRTPPPHQDASFHGGSPGFPTRCKGQRGIWVTGDGSARQLGGFIGASVCESYVNTWSVDDVRCFLCRFVTRSRTGLRFGEDARGGAILVFDEAACTVLHPSAYVSPKVWCD